MPPTSCLSPVYAGPEHARQTRTSQSGWVRRCFAVWVLACIVAFTGNGASASAISKNPDQGFAGPLAARKVLLLTSYGFGRPGVEEYISAFRRGLVRGGLRPDNIHVNYLNLEERPNAKGAGLRQALLADHVSRHPPDMLVLLQQPALNFALEYFPQLVDQTPVMAVFAQWPSGQRLASRGVTFHVPVLDAAGTLKHALSLFPKTEHVLVVVGRGEQDKLQRRVVEEAVASLGGRLQAKYTDGLPESDIEAQLQQLAPNTVVLLTSYAYDREGRTHTMFNVFERFAAVARAPVFAMFQEPVRRGALGGSVIQIDAEGERAAVRVVDAFQSQVQWPKSSGELASVPVPLYSWPLVQRWNGRIDNLPQDVRWLERPPSLWQEHRVAVISASLVIAVLALSVLLLARLSRLRLLASEAARQSEARQRVLIEHAPDAILVLDTSTNRFVDANPAALALFECSQERLLRASPEDLYHDNQPEDDASTVALQRNQDLVMAGESLQLLRHVKTFKGNLRICRVELVRLPDPARLLIRSSFTDITAMVRESEALRVSEERWHFALEGGGAGVWDIDLRTQQGKVTPRYCELLGFTPEEYAPHVLEWRSTLHPEDLPEAERQMGRHLRGETASYSGEFRLACKDGSWKWVHARGMVVARDASGRALRLVGTIHDITERKNAEASLQLAAMVYQHSTECMLVADGRGLAVAVNDAFVSTMGYSRADVLGRPVSDIWLKDRAQPAIKEMTSAIRAGTSWRGILWLRHGQGHAREVQLSVSVIDMGNPDQWRLVGLFSDITEQRAAQHQIWKQAHFDELTGLPNRRHLVNRFDAMLTAQAGSSTGEMLTVLAVNLDHFRTINETLSRVVADQVLVQVATRLQRLLRGTDVIARLGADEFVLVVAGHATEDQVAQCAEQILDTLRTPFRVGEHVLHLSATLGVAMSPQHGNTAEDLLRHAGQALEAAKAGGRDRFGIFSGDLAVDARLKAQIAHDLRAALDGNELEVHYQPIVHLLTGEVNKAEALLRWNHPDHPGIGPATFIPVAEQAGLIVALGDWVLARSVEQVKTWQLDLHPEFQVSVNRSPAQFNGTSTEDSQLLKALVANGVKGSSVAMEITEGLLLDQNERIRDNLNRLREAGIGISIDDFGTGYSSLAYVQQFTVDFIKIDRAFVRHIADNRKDQALCEATIAMAHKLDIQVIAEGIETEQQFAILRDIGCDYGQGYWFSRPVTPVEMAEWVKGQNAKIGLTLS